MTPVGGRVVMEGVCNEGMQNIRFGILVNRLTFRANRLYFWSTV